MLTPQSSLSSQVGFFDLLIVAASSKEVPQIVCGDTSGSIFEMQATMSHQYRRSASVQRRAYCI
jgi:hypothetical protein